ncbi:MAG: DegT/DnrJ/EryC1/StrS aminotransferase family protein [Pirellulales bacterium]
MRDCFLPFASPSIGQEEIDEVVDTLQSGWLTSGPKATLFEQEFAKSTQTPSALALNSCTAALHLALLNCGIQPDDEVITTGWTFASTVNVIEHVGAQPVLVDVEPDTLNLDVSKVEDAITPKTRAILPVHFAGHPVDLDAIHALADRYNLAVIEDAAHAIGASYKGRPIGSGTNPTAFSFYATKNLATGEGGMLTGLPDFLAQARTLSLHGMSREAWGRYQQGGEWSYDVVCPGFKYNMPDIQASLGLWQLRKMPMFQQRRREIVRAYQESFAGLEVFDLPVERPEVDHAWHLYVIRLRHGALRVDRDEFIRQLQTRNIGSSVHFIPIPMHSYYRKKYGMKMEEYPVMQQNYHRVISLPLNPAMTDTDVGDVIEAVNDIVKHNFRKAVA